MIFEPFWSEFIYKQSIDFNHVGLRSQNGYGFNGIRKFLKTLSRQLITCFGLKKG